MPDTSTHHLRIASPDLTVTVWTRTAREARDLAEALYGACPQWRFEIDGAAPVFSREGAIVDLVAARGAPARSA